MKELRKKDLHPDPLVQFKRWFEDAKNTTTKIPEAMTLSTANKEGIPSSRMILLKGVDDKGFIFYTNTNSRKGKEILENKYVSLCFWWEELERQVRVEGMVEMLPPSESDKYFSTRPRGSQIGAWASLQSEVIESRESLNKKFKEYEKKFEGKEIPRPPYWNGYRVIPLEIEFWQGREDRFHDRLRYRKKNDRWVIERLQP